MTEKEEMARMLLWFKGQLPPHALGAWYITVMPAPPPTVVVDTDTSCVHGGHWQSADALRVEGYGRCTRCGQRFALQESGNAIVLNEDGIGRKVEDLKDRARRDAERAGPCWGDVPLVAETGAFATLD